MEIKNILFDDVIWVFLVTYLEKLYYRRQRSNKILNAVFNMIKSNHTVDGLSS